MQVSHKPDHMDNDSFVIGTKFALKHYYLANANKAPHNSSTDSSHIYLINTAKAIGVNVDIDKEEYDRAKLSRL